MINSNPSLLPSIVLTKLIAPPLRPVLVPRPRLVERLEAARQLEQRLVLVSAPAGFGKTTLVGEWGTRAAWLSLDAADNDPARFFSYFAAAIARLDPALANIGDLVNSSGSGQAPPPDWVLSQIINAVSQVGSGTRFVLVLDDYHAISNHTIHQALSDWLDHSPPNILLVLITRADPPFSLARLRARHQMTEIRASDLRFSESESADFLTAVMGLALLPEQVAALDTRTEGWVAGLQLAGLSLRGRTAIPEFLSAFTGSHHYIVEYLTEEVLQQQSPEIREFLLATCILERMNAQVCDLVTQRTDSLTLLSQVEAGNLFLLPLDEERRWYRYHHLFADVLRAQANAHFGTALRELHRRASAAFEELELSDEAMHHALASQDMDLAVRLTEKYVDRYYARGESNTVLTWLNQIPGELFQTNPGLALARAQSYFDSNQLDAAGLDLDAAERALAAGLCQSPEEQQYRVRIPVMRAFIAHWRGQASIALELAHQALAILPPESTLLHSQVYQYIGNSHIWLDDLPGAADAFTRAIELSSRARDFPTVIFVMTNRGDAYFHQGKLRVAAQMYQDALELASARQITTIPATALAHMDLAHVQFEWNDLERAQENSETAIERSARGGLTRAEMLSRLILARILFARGDLTGAMTQLTQAERLVYDFKMSRRHATMVDAVRFQFWMNRGQLTEARAWMDRQNIDPAAPPTYLNDSEQLSLARLLVAEGSFPGGRAILDRSIAAARDKGRMWTVIRALITSGLSWLGENETERALEQVAQALAIAEPEGYIRTFLDRDLKLFSLIAQLAKEGAGQDTPQAQRLAVYAGRLVSLAKAETDRSRTESAVPPQIQGGLTDLTEREREILGYISAGWSNPEIAKHLHVEISTVKKHINNLFSKMGVKTRTQALVRARDLNLLS